VSYSEVLHVYITSHITPQTAQLVSLFLAE